MSDQHDDRIAPSGSTAPEPETPEGRAGGGSDEPREDTAGGVAPRAELEKVIRQRQAAKQRARAAEERLAALEAPEAAEDAAALERKLQQRQTQLAAMLRDQALRRAAARAGAINPDQVVAMLQSRVVMVEQADGSLAATALDAGGRALLGDDGAPADVDALVGGFLAEAANANLLEPVASPGSGARPTGTAPAEAETPASLEAFHALAPDQRRRAAMRMTRRQRERMLGLARPGRDGYL